MTKVSEIKEIRQFWIENKKSVKNSHGGHDVEVGEDRGIMAAMGEIFFIEIKKRKELREIFLFIYFDHGGHDGKIKGSWNFTSKLQE